VGGREVEKSSKPQQPSQKGEKTTIGTFRICRGVNRGESNSTAVKKGTAPLKKERKNTEGGKEEKEREKEKDHAARGKGEEESWGREGRVDAAQMKNATCIIGKREGLWGRAAEGETVPQIQVRNREGSWAGHSEVKTTRGGKKSHGVKKMDFLKRRRKGTRSHRDEKMKALSKNGDRREGG